MKSLKIPKVQSEAINRWRTDNTMLKRKGQKPDITMINEGDTFQIHKFPVLWSVHVHMVYFYIYMVKSFLKLIIFSFVDIILWKLYWNCQKYNF